MPRFKNLWLLFCQIATVTLAIIFVVSTLKPFWIEYFVSNIFDKNNSIQIAGLQDTTLVENVEKNFPGNSNNLRYAASKAMPSVIHIYTTQKKNSEIYNPLLNDPFFRRFFDDEFNFHSPNNQPRTGLGSGVILDDFGNIITNHHVIEKAEEIEISLADGRKAKAKIVGTDPETDLAVLKISLKGLSKITFGESDSIFVGDTVLAIGNPFGVGQTATQGIVSALGRNKLNINTFENFIQTDAAINPGNSGGALVDLNGNLIGINTAIYSQSGGSVGIGFAIPTSTVKFVFESIIKDGKVRRGFLGVQPSRISSEVAKSFDLPAQSGAFISRIVANGPADKAGLVPGDIVTKIDKLSITNKEELLSKVASIKPGSKIRIEFLRKGEKLSVFAKIGERPN